MNPRIRADDPLYAAGVLFCGKCGTASTADDATWLDEKRLLANYAPACEHMEPDTRILLPAELPQTLPHMHRRCEGNRRDGIRCSNRADADSLMCWLHGGRRG